jgi:hypothetical protein
MGAVQSLVFASGAVLAGFAWSRWPIAESQRRNEAATSTSTRPSATSAAYTSYGGGRTVDYESFQRADPAYGSTAASTTRSSTYTAGPVPAARSPASSADTAPQSYAAAANAASAPPRPRPAPAARAAGPGQRRRGGRLPDPPVDGDGFWVQLAQFPHRKSFGWFECECGAYWQSAHAYRDGTRQQCKSCGAWILPELMWHNTDPRVALDRAAPGTSDKPHQRSRCEKCIKLGRPCWQAVG